MNQTLKTWMILGAMLVGFGLWGWATGAFGPVFHDLTTIWNYLF